MLILLSPAKTLDFEKNNLTTHTQPAFSEHSQELVDILQDYSSADLSNLMGVSDKIATLNADRFQSYAFPFQLGSEGKQALLAFKGDVYKEWPLETYTEEDFDFAQNHLRILSGLYGLLRPLDLIRPYRLEMGTRLANDRGKNLYEFWDTLLTHDLNRCLKTQPTPFVVNLASNEYFQAVKPKTLEAPIISPVFKDWKNGKYKIISFFAKRARGAMAHYLLHNRVSHPDQIVHFTGMGYQYDPDLSSESSPVFLRRQSE